MSGHLRAAILGFGAIAAGRRGQVAYPMCHLDAYEALGDRVAVVAVADPDPSRCAEAHERIPGVRTYANVASLLADEEPDVVSVCMPPGHNCDGLLAACGTGARAVWCEKPVATRREQLARLQDAAAAMPVVQVGFWRQFLPEVRAVLEAAEGGDLGRIHLVSGCYAERYVGNGSHLVALAQAAVGPLELRSAWWSGAAHGDDGPACIHAVSRNGDVPVSFMPVPRDPYNVFEMDLWCEAGRYRFARGARRVERFTHVQDLDHPHLRILEETEMVERPDWKRAFEYGLRDLLDCAAEARRPVSPLDEALEGCRFLLDVGDCLAHGVSRGSR